MAAPVEWVTKLPWNGGDGKFPLRAVRQRQLSEQIRIDGLQAATV